MTVQEQSRFSQADQESVNALLQDYLNTGIEEEGAEQPFIAAQTQAERNRIWTAWTEFCGLIRRNNGEIKSHSTPQACAVDPDRFWVDFARDLSDPRVQAPVQTFLHQYLQGSVKKRVVPGPEERAMIRTLNSAYSVIEVWRRLVAAADFKVLRLERRALRRKEKYLEADRLFLKWEQEGEKREGPSYLIVRWILLKLSPALNLEINTLYVKVEATAADIILILLALYHRAEDIPASPLTRLSFHAAVLQMATGGFRSGSVMNTVCWQYTLSVVRDSDDPSRTKIVATPNIGRTKMKKSNMTSKYRKQRPLAYSTALVPYPLLCLGSLVIVRALQMGALEDFDSAHDLLHSPVLGKTDRIDIPWKEEFLEEPLFPLTYPQFSELWMRCLLVIGCRKAIRPYALPVGAGARMDERLSSALRNYVMSHSGAVFESDYQTGVVRPNLAEIAFGPKAVRRDETLFNDLRNMSLTRDEGAPISVSKEQLAKFQDRMDVARLRAEIRASTDQSEKKRLQNQMSSIIETCTKLQLKADRQAYFKRADRLRLQGLEPEPAPDRGGPGMAAPVAALLSHPDSREDRASVTADRSISERYINAQLLYLSSIAPSVRRRVPETGQASKSRADSCCFICFRSFSDRFGLTRHFRTKHPHGTFNKPLACPECKRLQAAEVVVNKPGTVVQSPRAHPWPDPYTTCQSRCYESCRRKA